MHDEPDAQRFNLSTVLEYYDIFEKLVVRHSLALILTRRLEYIPVRGGQAKHIIAQADLVMRTEMFRVNTMKS